MNKKIYSLPTLEQANKDDSNSINQIVLQMAKHLPSFGWEITDHEQDANLVAAHAGQTFGHAPCDIAHCHGLYPTFQFNDTKWHFAANAEVVKNLRHAKAITTPSQWVGDIIRRELNIEPTIVNWAIDHKQWSMQGPHKSYTLWNKTRISGVCDPTPIEYLAEHISDAKFITTFSKKIFPNLDVIGRQAFDTMRDIIQGAALYLATTKETFGIGTLEAMACGIPILGYKWGGTEDIVEHGLTGYLVEPGDLEGLITGWRWCMRHRSIIAQHARHAALNDHYTWGRVAQQFSQVYDRIYAEKYAELQSPIKVSVVIPVYNYAHWLPLALDSVLNQNTNFEYEVLIVDDGSTDNSYTIAQQYAESYPHIKAYSIPNNGVAGARDFGIQEAQAEYITCLDADDMLGDISFLQTLVDSLDSDPLLGIAYTGLAFFKDDPYNGAYVSNWPQHFDPALQYNGHNQVPTCNMFRKRAYLQTGGYRKHLQPAEDAGLWYQMSILGWSIRKVTNKALFFYRYHEDSLSGDIRRGIKKEPNWNGLHEASLTNRYPMASQLDPESYSKHKSHPVRNYDQPLFSIIIPVGKSHHENVIRAIDSVSSQSEWRWECIVINDSEDRLDIPQQWAKIINEQGAISKGAGMARNSGLDFARGKYILFLDADDMLLPTFLERAYQMLQATGHYVYSDWYEEREGNHKRHIAQEYSQAAILKQMSIHAITALIPKKWIVDVGGFDANLEAWEDTDLFIKLAIQGYCGKRINQALLVYNYDSGLRRELGAAKTEELKAIFRARYSDYMDKTIMPKKCCGKETQKPTDLNKAMDNVVRVMLAKAGTAPTQLKGPATGKIYGQRQRGDIFLMYSADVKKLPGIVTIIDNTESTIEATPEPSAPPTTGGD